MQRRFSSLAASVLFASLTVTACGRQAAAPTTSPQASQPPNAAAVSPGQKLPAVPPTNPDGTGAGTTVRDTVVPLPSPAVDPSAFTFVAGGHGWLSTGKTLLTTTDGGRSWTQVR